MEQYIIYADISADIPAAYADEHGIRFLPMNYTLGDEDRVCSGIEPESLLHRFYDGQRHGDMTHTSQISPQNYIDLFSPILAQGTSVLYLSLSSGLSGTYNSSCIAAEELSEKYSGAELVCVDTLAATGGMGLLLEMAVENRAKGMSIHANAEALEENRLRVCHWFMVEDLMYLKRGGRVGAGTAVLGTALNIKPILKIENDGTLATFAKIRGAKGAMRYMLDCYAASATHGDGERVYIVHADAQDKADFLEQEVKATNPNANVTTMMLSPIIGAHVGPGMCAVVHFGNRDYKK